MCRSLCPDGKLKAWINSRPQPRPFKTTNLPISKRTETISSQIYATVERILPFKDLDVCIGSISDNRHFLDLLFFRPRVMRRIAQQVP